jgi:hypothetical protein
VNLSDAEKEIILDHIKNNRPLPKEYIYKLFADDEDVFLFWNGRKEEVANVSLPFHCIEHIDEPRKETAGSQIGLFDIKGRQNKGWTNKLIWGDNKLVLSSLVNGPIRDEIEREGGLKLIYIDPPFAVGADFNFTIEINGEGAEKEQSVIEEIAYRDTWGRGLSSYLCMMYERLKQMYDLLSYNGSIYLHCDWRVNSILRLVLDDVFGSRNFRNQIAWHYSGWNKKLRGSFERRYDNILLYSKNDEQIFNSYFERWDSKEEYVKKRKQKIRMDDDNREYVLSDAGGGERVKRYLDEAIKEGVVVDDVWDLDKINNSALEYLNCSSHELC